jgi:tetratricopeptide (TPR) repeat protein
MQTVQQGSLFSSPEKRTVVLCLLLVVVTLALYNSTSSHPFVNYDDDRYITDNLHVRAGLTWDSIHWAFTSFDEANWHPVTWLSHELDCQLFKLNPAGHHYTNVLLQALNVVLLFLVLQWATGFTWRSLMVALLFAVHPVNVESVAWVAERKNLLSMMFLLLALAAYGSYARKPGIRQYVLVAILFACGLMAKPMVITFPFILLLWDYWPLRRMEAEPGGKRHSFKALVVEKIPLFAMSAGSAVITMVAQSEGGAVRSAMEFPFSERMGNAVVAYGRYLLNLVWPVRLAPMYPHSENGLAVWQIALSTLVTGALTVLVIKYRTRRYLPVGWFWFLGTLIPMIGLVQVGVQAMADRYAYLPYIGLFIMICWGVAELAEQRQLSTQWLAAPAFIALIVLSLLTYRQLGFWKDNVTLWRHTLQVTSENFVAEDNLGGALLVDSRVDEAMIHFRRAVEINPGDPVSNLNLATYEQQLGNLQKSIALYQSVLRMTPDDRLHATVFSNLGSAYRHLHDYDRAKQNYDEALRLVPGTPQAWTGLGLIAQKMGDPQEAARDYSRAMEIQPTDVGYLLMAQALEKAGKAQEAADARNRAQQLSPDLKAAQKGADTLLGE